MDKLRIVHLTTAHLASDVRIFQKEGRTLAQAGYDVTIVGLGEKDSVVDGVSLRVLSQPTDNRLKRMSLTVLRVLAVAIGERADVYHFHDPDLIPVGLILKLLGKQVVYDVHENTSKQIRSKSWIPRHLRSMIGRLVGIFEQLAAKVFDGIVAATPGIAYGFPLEKTVVVQNFALLEEFASIDTSDYADRPFTLAYLGGIAKTRGLIQMVDALERLDTNIGMQMAGRYSSSQLESQIQRRPGYSKVRYLGWLHRDGVREVLATSRVGMLVLHPEPNFVESYPVKLFEYMAAGLPVVASNFPFWEQFVKQSGAGLMVDPLDVDAIAEAIKWLLIHPVEAREMGERGRRVVLDRYAWQGEGEKLVAMYKRLLGVPPTMRATDVIRALESSK